MINDEHIHVRRVPSKHVAGQYTVFLTLKVIKINGRRIYFTIFRYNLIKIKLVI